jgi:hypothetical protein
MLHVVLTQDTLQSNLFQTTSHNDESLTISGLNIKQHLDVVKITLTKSEGGRGKSIRCAAKKLGLEIKGLSPLFYYLT